MVCNQKSIQVTFGVIWKVFKKKPPSSHGNKNDREFPSQALPRHVVQLSRNSSLIPHLEI